MSTKSAVVIASLDSTAKNARNPFLTKFRINPLNAELNPICHLLALLGAHHILHVSRIRVNEMDGGCGTCGRQNRCL